jgi:hypothetical protein
MHGTPSVFEAVQYRGAERVRPPFYSSFPTSVV